LTCYNKAINKYWIPSRFTHNLTYEKVADNLPDIELVAANQACD